MYLTMISLALYVGLLIANFTLAGISHHITAIRPIWALTHYLNKLTAFLILPAVVIDVLMLIF